MPTSTPSEDGAAILLLLSSPLDAPVGIDKARAHLQAALRDVRGAAHFVTRIAEADAVQGLLTQSSRPRFAVLHYLGHGYKPTETPHGALVFEDASGGAHFLDAFYLRAVLNPTNRPEPEFQVAVLMACHSESVALAMHALGVQHIVAIEADDSVLEVAAVAYFRRFYQTLLTGGTVADAHAAGRNAVLLDAQLAQDDPRTPLREAAKFKLLPAGADHNRPLAGLVHGDAPINVEALPTLKPPHFITPPRTFVGRAGDQRQVLQRLAGQRGLLIQGVSGVGKSALAWETARWLVARGRVKAQDVVFVALNNLHTSEDVYAALASVLGVSLGGATGDAAVDRLVDAVPARALLVIDEAETAVRGGGLVVRRLLERLVQAAAEPTVLVTSQNDVGSAFLPVYALQRLQPQAALALFASVANLTDTEWAALDPAQLLAALDYVDRLPRAVELVARTWRKNYNLNLDALLEDLAERHEEVMVDPAYPDEVKSVVVGVTLAFDRLQQRSVEAAELFLRLGLFPGGLSDAGVEEIFGRAARRLLPLIQDDSLVERPWPDLLYLPTPLRLFAERRLADQLAQARMQWGPAVLRHYHRLDNEPDHGHVDRLDADLQRAGDAMAAVIARYSQELASIETWLDWAYAHEPCAGERLRGPRLTALLENLYVVTDRLRHSRDRLERALAAAQRCGDRGGEANVQKALGDLALREADLAGARRRYEAALALYPQLGARLGEANVQKALGDLALREDDLAGARRRYEAALALYPQLGDRLGEANVQKALGDLALREADLAGARRRYEAALALYPQLGDRLGEANVLQALGDLALREADLAGARRRYEAALALYPQLGDRLGEANVQKALGDLALREDDLAGARRRYEAALALYPQLGDRLGEANVQKALGDLALREDDLAGARRRYEAALALYPQLGDRLGEANVQKALGDLALREADLAGARRRYEAALALYPQLGARLGEANVQKALGDLALREDDLAGARRRYEAALALYPQLGDRLGEANVQKALGDLALREDDLAGARRRYEAALALYPQLGDRLGEANVQKALGDLALREDDLAGARRRYEAALALYPQLGARLGEANVQKALGDLALREADLAGARRRYEAALALYPQLGARLGEANVLQALGDLALREADLAGARRRYEAALALYPQLGARLGEANVQKALGDLALREDDLAGARRRYEAALALYPQLGDRLGEANVQKALGDLALREADLAGARRRYEAALALYPQLGARLGEANVQKALGDLALREDDLAGARRRYEAALALYPQLGDRLGEANVQKALGDLALREDDLAGARRRYEAALALYPQLGDRLGQIYSWVGLGNVLLEERQFDAAMEFFEHALNLARQLELISEEASLLTTIAGAYDRLRQFNRALDFYTQAVERMPNVAMWRRNRASTYIRLRQAQLAEADLAVAAHLQPNHPYLPRRYADLGLLKGDYAAALQGYIDFAKVFPNDNGVHFGIALALWGLGQEDDSTRACTQALNLTHAVSDVEEALADLDDFATTHPDLPAATRLRTLLLNWLESRQQA